MSAFLISLLQTGHSAFGQTRAFGTTWAACEQTVAKAENGGNRMSATRPVSHRLHRSFLEKLPKFRIADHQNAGTCMLKSGSIEKRMLTIGASASAPIVGCFNLTAALTPITATAHPAAHRASLTELASSHSVFRSCFANAIRSSDNATRKPRKEERPCNHPSAPSADGSIRSALWQAKPDRPPRVGRARPVKTAGRG